jgi:prepilin-type processing-associated H-X9-DG protein
MLRASLRRGLTRVELVVVACLIFVVAGLVIPALQQARAGSNRRACQNNLRLIAIGMHNYHDTNAVFAPGMDNQYVGHLIRLLSYIDQDLLYRNFSFDSQYSLYWQNPYNRPPTDGTDDVPRPPDVYGCEWEVPSLLCPDGPQPDETVTALMVPRYGNAGVDYRADDGLDDGHIFSGSPGRMVMARTHYHGMAGDWRTESPYDGKYRGIFTYNSRTHFFDITDGLSNTIMYAEAWGGFIDWQGDKGIPSGWSTGSRSVGFNHSTFGTCPNAANPNCDEQSFGLSFGTYGALHLLHSPTGPALGFNVAMADGSVRTLRGDIDFGVWEAMSGIRDGEIHPPGLEPLECTAWSD